MDRDLTELLTGWEDDSLTAEEMDALAAWLERDPQARARAVRELTFSSDIARALRRIHQELPPWSAADKVSSGLPLPAQVLPQWRSRLSKGIKILVSGVAAALLLWLFWNGVKQAPERVIARLEAVHGEVYQVTGTARSPVQTGAEVRSGQGLETGEDSTAIIVFADGTRLQLGPDTFLADLTDNGGRGTRVDLIEGSLLADVARQPSDRPMLLKTARAELTGQGTKFLVCAGPSATHLELEQGLVRLLRLDDHQAIDVAAGFYALVATATEPLQSRPVPPQVRTPRLTLHGRFTSLAFSSDNQILATGSDGHVDLWDSHSGKKRTSHKWTGEGVHTLAFSPDGRTLAMGGKNSRGARLWEVHTDRFVQLGGGGMIHRLAYSPDGQTLALSRRHDSFQLWDALKRVERCTLSGHTGPVTDLAFGPDSQTMVSSSEDGALKLWNAVDGGELATLTTGVGSEKSRKSTRVLAVAFSADGNAVAAGFHNGTIQLWDLAARKLRASLQQHTGPITALAFAPDGKLLASGSKDHAVKLWDPIAAAPEVTLLGHDDWIVDVAFSRDGNTLASIGKDQKANLWSVQVALKR
jgi:WD40 repeat protein/ferric-dicitrate binding protein FerR (iron transport regulator)